MLAGTRQPRYSRDAIAEFEFVSNRFDATQGRSAGVQVNAITKSGTNTPAGTFSGYFRDDSFNAEDFIEDRSCRIRTSSERDVRRPDRRRDRIHFFANYEYEREPQTFTYNSPYPSFNVDRAAPATSTIRRTQSTTQFTPQQRLAVRSPLPARAVSHGRRRRPCIHRLGACRPACEPVLRHLHPGPRQPGGQRGQGRLRGYNWTNDNYVIDERIGGRGLEASPRDAPSRSCSAATRSAPPPIPRRTSRATTSIRDDFTLHVQREGPPRPESRRRVPPHLQRPAVVQLLQRTPRCQRRTGAREHGIALSRVG